MDLVEQLLNIIAPPITATLLFIFLQFFQLFRFLLTIFRSMFREKVAGKVVLITGASSGIGEHVAYEYARRGACLAFVARRKNLLQEVADRARYLESPDVIVIPADVSKVEDCKRFVDETVNHFARLDHLVNNAGIANMNMFEEADDIKKLAPVMETNFWGSVNSTYFALPHLRKSRGKVLVTASAAGWLTAPRLSFYSASKAAVIIFFETLRIELGSDVGITTVSPGLTESEITRGKFLSKEGITVLDQDMRDVQITILAIQPVEPCAEAIVKSACRGDKYLIIPTWIGATLPPKVFFPGVLDWCNKNFLLTRPGTPPTEAIGKKILDITRAKRFLYPSSVRSPNIRIE